MSLMLLSILGPLEDLLRSLLDGIHRITGLSWAWSIIAASPDRSGHGARTGGNG